MKSVSRIFVFLAALMILGGAASVAEAQSPEEEAIRGRMLKRIDAVDALKLSGKAGENNVGLLEQRAALSPSQTQLMNDENADRRALYTLLAKRLGLTMSVVGQGRAEELRKRSAPGVWVEDRNGNWERM